MIKVSCTLFLSSFHSMCILKLVDGNLLIKTSYSTLSSIKCCRFFSLFYFSELELFTDSLQESDNIQITILA